jgi:hypothetical protein
VRSKRKERMKKITLLVVFGLLAAMSYAPPAAAERSRTV